MPLSKKDAMDKDQILQQLEHIREFQINDLKKADETGANFLVCVGCLNATEVLGGIRTGLIGKERHAKRRLSSGLDLLGSVYRHHEKDIFDLRNSMVHAYLGKTENYSQVDITNKTDRFAQLLPPLRSFGILIANGRFTVNVSKWIEDLDDAWRKLVDELKADSARMASIGTALEALPYLR